MKSKIINGVLAGLIAGVAFGVLMSVISVPNEHGEKILMMKMVAMVIGQETLFYGWLYHLFNASIIGAMFGMVYGPKLKTYKSGLICGSLYGVVWWISGGLILMPVFLGNHIFGPIIYSELRPLAIASLAGHLLYGLILGLSFAYILKKRANFIKSLSKKSSRRKLCNQK
ncbi:MAG: hypothetical protein KC478_15655 [Bacteriovoracaceae bacterium]|nr:hypothetical protein [Bacteriovoracaceae bacterium]